MIRLYIVRHGKTQWNTESRMQGWKDTSLVEEGIHLAQLLGRRLATIDFTAVYTSPSGRTLQTTELLLNGRNIPVNKEPLLREMSFGMWEGKKKETIRKQFSDEYEMFWNKPHLYKAKTGENYLDVQKRGLLGLKSIVMKHSDGDNVLIVSHCIMIKSLIYSMKKEAIDEFFWGKYSVPNGSLTVAEFHEGEFSLSFIGDTNYSKLDENIICRNKND
ncbi:histidine phosphatase family protein [Caldibacillus lycopersici]|uniref:Histidine phosphatase family protein n=1 Tax=Perspicuibacillus lycopersici TaxID=1325689 RepID=A0AAE3IU66_9BACI|nr:histidine phosphatase family protein [Perspicuibacillus lycopersici]MCU9614678.1 histidine phosphatase family protein [Perspicuibacillus lycopersici]